MKGGVCSETGYTAFFTLLESRLSTALSVGEGKEKGKWVCAFHHCPERQAKTEQIKFFGMRRYALLREGVSTWEDLVEETAGKKPTVRLRLLEELRGDAAMQVAAQGPNPSVKAALALAGVRAERAAMENARHEAVARKFEETAPKQNAAKRVKIKRLREARRVETAREKELVTKGKLEAAMAMGLFAKAGTDAKKLEQARAAGEQALRKILRGSGLVNKNFGLAGVEFVEFEEDNVLMETSFKARKIRVSVKENV